MVLLVSWCLGGLLWAQGPARTVHVSAPRARVIAGEQIQLAAIARDANGVARTGDTFNWTSSSNTLATVNAQGLVTARGLGLVDITAGTAGATAGAVRIQVLPLRVDVFPLTGELLVGDQLQYTALAYDANEAVISNAAFQWTITGANGGGTQAAAITGQGLFAARAVGLITVRAFVAYAGGNNPFISQFSGYARIRIKPRNQYRLTRLLASDEERHSFQLRPVFGSEIAVNDAGQIAYMGSLDGLTGSLLLYDNGRFEILAKAGDPGPLAGGFIFNFGSPSMNNRGQVLIRVGMQNSSSGVLLASREGSAWVLVDGQPGGGVENLVGSTIFRDSLNDNGDFVFAGSYQLAGSTSRFNGLFRYTASTGALQRIWGSNDALPGLAAPITFNAAGIDRDGVVYFMAVRGSEGGIYRQQGFSPPAKVIVAGDSAGGATVRTVICCRLGVGAAGEVAFRANLTDGRPVMIRSAGGQVQTLAVSGHGDMVSVNSTAGVVFRGDAGRGWGLYRWQGSTATPVLIEGRLAPNDEPIEFIEVASVTARGEVIAQMRTYTNPLVVAQAGSPGRVLFDTGTRVNVTANVQLFLGSLIRGLGSGPPRLILGFQGSIFEIGPQGLVPRLILGDRLADGVFYTGIGARFEHASNDLYFDALGGGFTRVLSGERVDDLVVGNFQAADGVFVNRGLVRFVGEQGAMLWDAGTNRAHGRLYLTQDGRHTLLATNSADPQFATPGPAGGAISGWGSLALDNLGRVMAQLNVRNGTSGVFLWANGRWQPVALFGQYMIGNQRLSNASVQAVGDKFYASLQAGISIPAEWREQNWTHLLTQTDVMPNGSNFNGLRAWDVNRRGEMAFVAGTQGGGDGVFVRSSEGLRTVYINNEPTEAGDYLRNLSDVELREDGRVYFTATDVFDRTLLYVAEPLLTNWPARSRQRR